VLVWWLCLLFTLCVNGDWECDDALRSRRLDDGMAMSRQYSHMWKKENVEERECMLNAASTEVC
jgi:hypothetical protein